MITRLGLWPQSNTEDNSVRTYHRVTSIRKVAGIKMMSKRTLFNVHRPIDRRTIVYTVQIFVITAVKPNTNDTSESTISLIARYMVALYKQGRTQGRQFLESRQPARERPSTLCTRIRPPPCVRRYGHLRPAHRVHAR
jgi:hypothetical protein